MILKSDFGPNTDKIVGSGIGKINRAKGQSSFFSPSVAMSFVSSTCVSHAGRACHANQFDGCLQCLQSKCFQGWQQYCKVQYYQFSQAHPKEPCYGACRIPAAQQNQWSRRLYSPATNFVRCTSTTRKVSNGKLESIGNNTESFRIHCFRCSTNISC